jgi:hypothetical protein
MTTAPPLCPFVPSVPWRQKKERRILQIVEAMRELVTAEGE